MIAKTPTPPYYAVIFTSLRTNIAEGYDATAQQMIDLAQQQEGFLGLESARNEIGITVSYWESLAAIKKWREHSEHSLARDMGRAKWYQSFKTRICLVERDYSFENL
jgi:heme-degrading monooxygenase HmoA